MPEGYTHVRIAKNAAEAAALHINHPEAFACGANGPDIFFFFEVWKSGRKRRFDLPELGNRMHEEQTGRFLLALMRHAKTEAQQEFALGFLCHYATDTVIHPYVTAMTKEGMPYGGPGGHGYLEIALASKHHEEDYGDPVIPSDHANPMPPSAEMEELADLLHDSLAEAYHLEVKKEWIVKSFQDMHFVRSFFTSRHGFMRSLYGIAERFIGGKGFITSHVSPLKLSRDLPERWVDPVDGEERTDSLEDLVRSAEERSAYFMKAGKRYFADREEEALRKTLGSMSYTTGTETEESAG